MEKDSSFKSIVTLQEEINSKLDLISKGACSLQEMEMLLSDIRELEERVVIIKYKAMERLSASESQYGRGLTKEVREPELPLEIDSIAEAEDLESKQISLIDSIEEISREVSVNEDHLDKGAPSLAEKLEALPIESILKSLSINQKIGFVNQLFKGNDQLFKETLEALDKAEDLHSAKDLLNDALPEGINDDNPLLIELHELAERRFL